MLTRLNAALLISLSLVAVAACDTSSPSTPTDASSADGDTAADTVATGGCRADSDCTGNGERCLAPGESAGCGICRTAERLCAGDTDCTAQEYCREYQDPCTVTYCSPGGLLSSMCTPRCTAASCGAGTHCDTDGRCKADACGAGGFTCPAPTLCQAGTAGADGHGCVRPTCAADATCGAGAFCVEGACYATLGACSPPVP